jgi:hypothetical protein
MILYRLRGPRGQTVAWLEAWDNAWALGEAFGGDFSLEAYNVERRADRDRCPTTKINWHDFHTPPWAEITEDLEDLTEIETDEVTKSERLES